MEKQMIKPKWHNVEIAGAWRLTYKVTNTIGVEAFGGKHLGLYNSPYDGTRVRLRDVNHNSLAGFMIDKLVMIFNPDENENEKLLISWLIGHPEVTLQGIPNLDEVLKNKKEASGKIVLTAMDYIELELIDDEDFIDKLIGTISLDGGPRALGLEKLRHVMAELGLPYSLPQFKGDVEKKALRSKLKTHVRKSIENAKRVQSVIDNIESAREHFEFKEMLRTRLITTHNGLYKFNNIPLGSSFEQVQVYFSNNPDVREALTNSLIKESNKK